MTTDQMKVIILKAYPRSHQWPARVANMSDGQVLAVFNRLKSVRKI